jgi:hypothetical protein
MKDLGNAFSFVFKDSSWVTKVLVGCLFMILSIIGFGLFVVAGYIIQTVQRVMNDEPDPMPEWNDLGIKFVIGFKFAVVYAVYLLPILFLIVPLFAFAIAAELSPGQEVIGLIASIYAFGFTILVIPYSVALNVIFPIIVYRFAMRERIGDALDIVEIIRIFAKNWQNTLIVALITVGVQSFAAVGLVFFLVGILATVLYSYLVSAYLAGALYREHFPGAQPRTVVPAW